MRRELVGEKLRREVVGGIERIGRVMVLEK